MSRHQEFSPGPGGARGHRASELLARIFSPLNQSQMGNGMPSTMASPARRELPPPFPSLANIWLPKSGKAKPSSDRKTEAAASALAA